MLALLKNKNKILGMNARNLSYIRPANKKRAVNLANNKLDSKQALIKAGVPVANLFGVIKNRKQLLSFDWNSLPNSFVLKPNHGLGGEGIVVVFGKKKNQTWIGSDEHEITTKDLIDQTSNILDGNFSLSNIPDIAFFEERLQLDSEFKKITYKGIPDIRILIYNNVPVMAMLRLPTKESHGKANLHQGGIGVGIDLATGVTTFATQKDTLITKHPDTNQNLNGIIIPEWDNLLKIAITSQQVVGLGYSGVDIVIDRDKGPIVLEVNGHPGLSIQNANLISLKDRLDRVAGLEINTPSQGIKVAKQLFSQKSNTAIEDKEDKQILGFLENVTIKLPNIPEQCIRAKIDTGIASTTINRGLAKKLGFNDVVENFDKLIDNKEKFPASYIKKTEEQINNKNNPEKTGIKNIVGVKKGDDYILRPKIDLEFTLKKQIIKTELAIGRNHELSYPMVIGRRDLNQFLIDPTKSIINKQ